MQIRMLYSEKEMLLASNKSLAEYNLSQEPLLKEKRAKLQEKHRELTKKAEKVRLLKKDVAEKSGKAADPEDLLALLEAAGLEAEDDSEDVADKYIHGNFDGSVEDFVKVFVEKRKLAHTRRIKIDKMKELLRNGSRQGTPTRRAPAVPPPANYHTPVYPPVPTAAPAAPAAPAPANNLPYPINPTGMPQPF